MKITLNILFLLTIWFLISGHFSFLPVVPGVITILIISYLFYRLESKTSLYLKNGFNPFAFASYLVFLFIEIIKSNIYVATMVLKNKSSVSTVEIEAKFKTSQSKALLANSITATPGTMTVDVKENSLVINCLTEETKKGVTSLSFNKKIEKIEK